MSYNETEWQIVDTPGYLGKSKDKKYQEWTEKWGSDWRIAWEVEGNLLEFREVFDQVYVPGYKEYFVSHPDEAELIVSSASYTYDKDLITKEQAFDPMALYERPGKQNQFHNVALNIALVELGYKFIGDKPFQVREGKIRTPIETWPEGWRWSPGRIPALHRVNVRMGFENRWWSEGSVEDVYQTSKVLIVRKKNGQ